MDVEEAGPGEVLRRYRILDNTEPEKAFDDLALKAAPMRICCEAAVEYRGAAQRHPRVLFLPGRRSGRSLIAIKSEHDSASRRLGEGAGPGEASPPGPSVKRTI